MLRPSPSRRASLSPEIISEGRVDGNDICFLCRRADLRQNLGLWLVGDALRPVHLECWLASYDPRSPSDPRDVGARRPPEHGAEQTS